MNTPQAQPDTSTEREAFLSANAPLAEVRAAAHDLDVEVMEISNGKRKPGRLSLEKLAILISYARRAAQAAPSQIPEGWSPTAENINALPAPVRNYIHALEANCDPSGTVADNTIKADTIRALAASNRRIRDEFDTPGNRNTEARYAGYSGHRPDPDYTADQLAAWKEGNLAARAAPQPPKDQP